MNKIIQGNLSLIISLSIFVQNNTKIMNKDPIWPLHGAAEVETLRSGAPCSSRDSNPKIISSNS